MKRMKRPILMLAIISSILGVVVLLTIFSYNNQFYVQKVNSAIEREDINDLQRLVEYPFGNLNAKPSPWLFEVLSESNELTPLQYACKLGNPEIVKLLLDNGAQVNYTNWDKSRDQGSPLMNAASSLSDERLQVIKLLVEHGADITYESIAGNDALSCAVYSSFGRQDTIEIIEYLERNGMNINKRYSESENTLLHKACECDSILVVQYLVEQRGFDVNVTNKDGDTPIICFFRFASDRKKDTLLLLLQNGADIEQKNEEGKSAYDYAIERHPEFVAFLQGQGDGLGQDRGRFSVFGDTLNP